MLESLFCVLWGILWGRVQYAVTLGHLFAPIFILMPGALARPIIMPGSSTLFSSLRNLWVNSKT